MACNAYGSIIKGEVAGYKHGWIPMSPAHMVVKTSGDMIKIPVDQRQVKFIQKEYPVGDTVELEYDGCWHIMSRLAPEESKIQNFLYNTY